MIIIIERELTKKEWLTESEFIEILSIAQAIPGAIIINAAFLTGKKISGIKGALAAMCGVIIPPFVVLSLVAIFINSISDIPQVAYFFKGVYGASIGMILNLLLRMKKKVVWTLFTLFLTIFGLIISFINHSFIIPVFFIITFILYFSDNSQQKNIKYIGDDNDN